MVTEGDAFTGDTTMQPQRIEISRIRAARRLDPRAIGRVIWQIAQAVVILGILGFLIWRGAQSMDYNWQWYRAAPFFYRMVDGELLWGPLVKGLIVTLKMTAFSAVITLVIGLVTAFMRLSDSISGRVISKIYLEAIRNTPLLVQLFLFYFVLAPIFGIDRFWVGVLCLSFFEGSFAAEIIRGGIIGVDRGQYEAADAIGLNRFEKFRRVVIPQSLPMILPPLTGVLISLIKNSAIVSVIAVSELTTAGLNLISDTFMAFEVWFIVAGIYLAITISLSVAVSIIEVSLNKNRNNR